MIISKLDQLHDSLRLDSIFPPIFFLVRSVTARRVELKDSGITLGVSSRSTAIAGCEIVSLYMSDGFFSVFFQFA